MLVSKVKKTPELQDILEDLVDAVQALADRDAEAPVVNVTVPPVEIPAPHVTVQAPTSVTPLPAAPAAPIKQIRFDISRDSEGRATSVTAHIVG